MAIVKSEQIRPGLRAISQHDLCAAVDLGQSQDPTAFAVVEKISTEHVTSKGAVTHASEEYHLRYLKRLPLGLSYVDQRDEITAYLNRPPLTLETKLILDETGVGRACADIFEDAGLQPIRVSITAGTQQTCLSSHRWHVPKQVLISNLDARLHRGELKIARALAEADVLRQELKDFRRLVSAAGRASYSARTGKHDDLVLATSLALWGLVGLPESPQGFSMQARLTTGD